MFPAHLREKRFCGLRNVTLNSGDINWQGLRVSRKVDSSTLTGTIGTALPPFSNFNLTVCNGLCRSDSLRSPLFNSTTAKTLSRVNVSVLQSLHMAHAPCCVPSHFGDEPVVLMLNHIDQNDRDEEIQTGTVRLLYNALACVCA